MRTLGGQQTVRNSVFRNYLMRTSDRCQDNSMSIERCFWESPHGDIGWLSWHLQHQRNIYHVFMDFKKAFDRVWHEALWATMKNSTSAGSSLKPYKVYNILYENTSVVLVQEATEEWFLTSVGVIQGCMPSPTLFNIFLEEIMTHALLLLLRCISIAPFSHKSSNSKAHTHARTHARTHACMHTHIHQ